MQNPFMELSALPIHKVGDFSTILRIIPSATLNIIFCHRVGKGNRHFRGNSSAKALRYGRDLDLRDVPIISTSDSRAFGVVVLTAWGT